MRVEEIDDYRQIDQVPAVVLGTATTGLSVIRSLGRMGVPVVGVDKEVLSCGFFSRYCRSLTSPDPEIDEDGYVRLLLELGEHMGGRPILFPSRDREVTIIARHRGELERLYRIPVAESRLIEQLVNKRKFYELIRNLQVYYPVTYVPESLDHVNCISLQVKYPYIVKPVHTIPFSRQFGVKCFYASGPEELLREYQKAVNNGHEVIIQEVIPGDERCLYHLGGYFDGNSEPAGIFLQRKIRNCPEMYGIGSLAEGAMDPGIMRAGTQFMKDIGYTGIGVVEMKKDPRDGRYKVLEVNARPWTQMWLVTSSGVNLPYLAYLDMIGKPVPKALDYRPGLKWLCMSDDFRTCLNRFRKGAIGPGEYINSLRGKKVYSVLDFADPVPFLLSPLQLGNMGINYLRKKTRRTPQAPAQSIPRDQPI
jgi:predicted ATP-grasp superfamily ATP-dependent carboligase